MFKLQPANCPICGEKLSEFSRGRFYHAFFHGVTNKELFDLTNNICAPQKCQCSDDCKEITAWKSWEVGYATYTKGHYKKEIRSQVSRENVKIFHWSRGKTKDTDNRLKKAGEKVRNTLQEKYKNGELIHWCSGKNAKDDERIKNAAENRKGKLLGKHHHKWTGVEELKERITESSSNLFKIKTIDGREINNEFLESRTNNAKCFVSVTCNRCNKEFQRSIYGIIRGKLRCDSCDRSYSSNLEKEIHDFVCSLTNEKIYKRYLGSWGEIDIYVPNKNLGIEVNGLYWHSEAILDDKLYHQKKSDKTAEKGIKLVQIYEDDWRTKREIVESIIRHRLGLSQKIGARLCELRQLSSEEKKKFFDENHIDGDTKSSLALGLIYNKEIIAAASYRTPFHKKWDGYAELARFCTKKNVSVAGALSKLTKHFVKTSGKSLMSYQDTRLGGSRSYEQAGFKKVDETSVMFWWTDTQKRYNRFSTRASGDNSEEQNSIIGRKLKIWGNKNYIWVYENT